MVLQQIAITGSMNTLGPGVYTITAAAAGATLTLENWAYWPDESQSILVKDTTGSPSLTVAPPVGGTIDGQASVTISNGYESLTFRPFFSGSGNGMNWIIT